LEAIREVLGFEISATAFLLVITDIHRSLSGAIYTQWLPLQFEYLVTCCISSWSKLSPVKLSFCFCFKSLFNMRSSGFSRSPEFSLPKSIGGTRASLLFKFLSGIIVSFWPKLAFLTSCSEIHKRLRSSIFSSSYEKMPLSLFSGSGELTSKQIKNYVNTTGIIIKICNPCVCSYSV